MSQYNEAFRIGIDTGGTFTDVTLVDEASGRQAIRKVPSTPDNPARAVMEGVHKIIKEEKVEPHYIHLFLHGTTVATNTLIEKTGAKTILVTTEGFRDVLEIGRQTRPSLYDFRKQRPEPLIPRKDRREITERILHTGDVAESLDAASIDEVVNDIRKASPEVVAVSLLNSYANPEHEQTLENILNERFPDMYVSISSDVLPEMKEYERTSTVAANAYVMPMMDRYLSDLEKALKKSGIPSDLYIMQSNGGVIAANEARKIPARTTLSGPVGGVMAGRRAGEETNHTNVITLDMGGTSLDVCLVENGEAHTTTESVVAGHPIKSPMLDIHTIGAGGGSIAWVDDGGALRVGPRSAGAVPGPVCYGHGGEHPTVTDAHAILGRLNPGGILGGDMQLDIDAAREAIREKIAEPLHTNIEHAAQGILQVVNTNMMRGIRVVSVERGSDPRDFSMTGFGGAGPLHIADLAASLGIEHVIIPPAPGIASAVGMIMSDVRHDDVRTFFHEAAHADLTRLATLFDDMENTLVDMLEREGFPKTEQEMEHYADFRYRHQSYEIQIPLAGKTLSGADWKHATSRFHEAHEQLYGYRLDEVVESVHVRTVATGNMPNVQGAPFQKRTTGVPEPTSTRDIYWDTDWRKTPIYNRADLYAGDTLTGPTIIEQMDSTITVPPENTVSMDASGNCIITRKTTEQHTRRSHS